MLWRITLPAASRAVSTQDNFYSNAANCGELNRADFAVAIECIAICAISAICGSSLFKRVQFGAVRLVAARESAPSSLRFSIRDSHLLKINRHFRHRLFSPAEPAGRYRIFFPENSANKQTAVAQSPIGVRRCPSGRPDVPHTGVDLP